MSKTNHIIDVDRLSRPRDYRELKDNLSYRPRDKYDVNSSSSNVFTPSRDACSMEIEDGTVEVQSKAHVTIHCSFSRDGWEIYDKADKQRKGGIASMQFDRTVIKGSGKDVIRRFADYILKGQKTFCHLFTEKNEDRFMISGKTERNFKAADVLFLDFDDLGAIDIDTFIGNIKSTGNVPFFVHESLSSTSVRRKYHCYFLLAEPIRDAFAYGAMAKRVSGYINKLCGMQADRRTLNATQCAFPGKVDGEYRILEEGLKTRIKPQDEVISTQEVHLLDVNGRKKGRFVFTTTTLAGASYDAKADLKEWTLERMRQMDMTDMVKPGYLVEDDDPRIPEQDKVVSIYDAKDIGQIWPEQLCTVAMMAVYKDRIIKDVTEDFDLMITGQEEKDFIFNMERVEKLGEKAIYKRTSGHEPRHYHLAKFIYRDGFVEGAEGAYTRSDDKRMVPLSTNNPVEILRRAALATYQGSKYWTQNMARVEAKLSLYRKQTDKMKSLEAEAKIQQARKIYKALKNVYTINTLSDIVSVDKRFIFTRESGWMGLAIPLKWDANLGKVVGPVRRDGQGRRRWLIKRLIERRIIAKQLDSVIPDFSSYVPEEIYFRGIVNDLNYIDTEFEGEDLIEIVMNVLMKGLEANITPEVEEDFKKENLDFWFRDNNYVINQNFVRYYGAVENKAMLLKGAKYIYATSVEVPKNYERFSSLLEMTTFNTIERMVRKGSFLVFRRERLGRLDEKCALLGMNRDEAYEIVDDKHSDDFIHVKVKYDPNDTSREAMKTTLARLVVFGLAMRMYMDSDGNIYASSTGIGMDELHKKNKYFMHMLRYISDMDRKQAEGDKSRRLDAMGLAEYALLYVVENKDTNALLYEKVFDINGLPRQEEIALYPEMASLLNAQLDQMDYLRTAYCYEHLSQIANEYLSWVNEGEKKGGLAFSFSGYGDARGYQKLTDQHYAKIYLNSMKAGGVLQHKDHHVVGIEAYMDFIDKRLATAIENKSGGAGLWRGIKYNAERYGQLKAVAPYTQEGLSRYVAENLAPSSRKYLTKVIPGYDMNTYVNQIMKQMVAALWYLYLLKKDNIPHFKDYDFPTFYRELWQELSLDTEGVKLSKEIELVHKLWREIPLERLLDQSLSPGVASKIVLANGVLSVAELKKVGKERVIEALTTIARCMLQQGGYERPLHDDNEVRDMLSEKVLNSPAELMDVITQEHILIANVPSEIKKQVDASSTPVEKVLEEKVQQEEAVLDSLSCFFDETGKKKVQNWQKMTGKTQVSEREAKTREVFHGVTEEHFEEFLSEVPDAISHAYGTLTSVLERYSKGRNREKLTTDSMDKAIAYVGMHALDKLKRQVSPVLNEATASLRTTLLEHLFSGRVSWSDYSKCNHVKGGTPLHLAGVKTMVLDDETKTLYDVFTLGKDSYRNEFMELINQLDKDRPNALGEISKTLVQRFIAETIEAYGDDDELYNDLEGDMLRDVKGIIMNHAETISEVISRSYTSLFIDSLFTRDIFKVSEIHAEMEKAFEFAGTFYSDIVTKTLIALVNMMTTKNYVSKSAVASVFSEKIAKGRKATFDVDAVSANVLRVLNKLFVTFTKDEEYEYDMSNIQEKIERSCVERVESGAKFTLAEISASCFCTLYRDYADMESVRKSQRKAMHDILFGDRKIAKRVYYALQHIAGRIYKITSQFNIGIATIASARSCQGNVVSYISADKSAGYVDDIVIKAFTKIQMMSPSIDEDEVILGVGPRGLDGVYVNYFRPRTTIVNYEVFSSAIASEAVMDNTVKYLLAITDKHHTLYEQLHDKVGIHLALSDTHITFGIDQDSIARNFSKALNNMFYFTNRMDKASMTEGVLPAYEIHSNPRLASMIMQKSILSGDKIKEGMLKNLSIDNLSYYKKEHGID